MLTMKTEEESLIHRGISEIDSIKKELHVQIARNGLLEKENNDLKQEVARLRTQLLGLKAVNNERKSMMWKKIQNTMENSIVDVNQEKEAVPITLSEKTPAVQQWQAMVGFKESPAIKETPGQIPDPPSKPTTLKEEKGNREASTIAPPPPPAPSRSLLGSKAIRRVPELIELYRSLTRKNTQIESGTNLNGTPVVAFTKNMIGEIENRSTYHSAIKSDVQTQGEFVRYLIIEIESACYTDISYVEAFVKWLDGQLSSLVDERAVLKHFPQWPEQKTDALREAACTYRDLKNLESEVSSFEDNLKEPLAQALKRMQSLQDRIERSISNIERTRETTMKRYRNLQIPWEWMQDTGVIGQIKLSSLKLAKEYMKRITSDLQSNECLNEANIMLQGVRFAYRIHQFVGGFNGETIRAFEELKKLAGNIVKCCKEIKHEMHS